MSGYQMKDLATNTAMHIIRQGERNETPTLSAFDYSYAMSVMTGFPKEVCLDTILDEQKRIRQGMEAVKKAEKSS